MKLTRQSHYSLQLSPRERQILILVANGATNSNIAKALDLSERTIETTLWQARHKLGAANRAQAVAIAIKRRDIDLDDITDTSGPGYTTE